MLSMIVAMSERHRVIGLEGDLPWKLSADLKRFKEITTGHTVVMGRKTWESIPEKFRPLPNRKNIVLTRQESYVERVPEGVGVSSSLEEAVALHASLAQTPVAEKWGDLFLIGGTSVFESGLEIADRLYRPRRHLFPRAPHRPVPDGIGMAPRESRREEQPCQRLLCDGAEDHSRFG